MLQVHLDMLAAFDTVDYGIILDILIFRGFTRTAFTWFMLYLAERSHMINVE